MWLCRWGFLVCKEAAKCGHLEVLQWALEQIPPCPWDVCTCKLAAACGHLEVLKWARANDCPWDDGTCSYAAGGGHLELLQWAGHGRSVVTPIRKAITRYKVKV
jgi:hypothetical protein